MKLLRPLSCLLALIPLAAAFGQHVLIDFGNHLTAPSTSQTWNNLTSSAPLAPNRIDLLDAQGAASDVGLYVITAFSGSNASGTQTPAAPLPPSTVTRDSLFANIEPFEGKSDVIPELRLDGLVPGRRYSLRFFASRMGATDNRTARYTITGEQTVTVELDAANNTDRVALATVVPTAEGTLSIVITPADSNNNANHFTYLGSLEIKPAPTYRHSRVDISPPDNPGPYAPGSTFTVRVDYDLDPDDVEGGLTRIAVIPIGPYVGPGQGSAHVAYPGLATQRQTVEPGSGTLFFTFTVGTTLFQRNELHFIARFENAAGQRWPIPWSYEGRTDEPLKPRIRLAPAPSFYSLSTEKPANLFTYDDPVKIRLRFETGSTQGQSRTLNYTLHDAYGESTTGTLSFTTGAAGQTTELTLPGFTVPDTRRGTFVLEATVADWGSRELVFARIPDLSTILGTNTTPFGATDVNTPSENAIARRLGFSHVRHHNFHWAKAQPSPDSWQLSSWDTILANNAAQNLRPHVTLWRPPLWILPEGKLGGTHSYQPFSFDHAEWRQSIRHLSTHWANTIQGFELLNEIVSGTESPDPVADYLEFSLIAAEERNSVAPNLHLQLAGGIHPRNFRQAILQSGVGDIVDALPVHYGNEASIRDAREDLSAVGLANDIPVWDNESARAHWVWDWPWRDIISDRTQSEWVLTRFPGQLAAGAERVFYFGGWSGGAAGGWNYLMDGETPRPVAVTLAVQAAKLGLATPVGSFHLGELGRAHLFKKTNAKPVLVAYTTRPDGETISLPVATATVTDYQGNETTIPSVGGRITLSLSTMPVFVETTDVINAWRSFTAVKIGDGFNHPRFVRAVGSSISLPVSVKNPFTWNQKVTVELELPPDMTTPAPVVLFMSPGQETVVQMPLTIPADLPLGRHDIHVKVTYATSDPAVNHVNRQLVILNIVDPSMLDNLVANPGFETAGTSATRASQWGASSQAQRVANTNDLTPGLGGHSMLISNPGAAWGSVSQAITAVAGQSYLYSLWARTENVTAGSNVTFTLANGSKQTRYINGVFSAPTNSPWRLMTARIDSIPANTATITLTPVATGAGHAAFDNVRLTYYDGTHYATEARRRTTPVQVDGHLDDWSLDRPVPLLADNQLAVHDPAYAWTPANLSGAAWFTWDDDGLYLAARVRDDLHRPLGADALLDQGDSLILAIHPENRAPGADARAFAYVVSAAPPLVGGGSHTLYRPSGYAGGNSSGHLARDSSVYNLAVRRADGFTTYELFMPWDELGGRFGAGDKLGLSLTLHDNDGGDARAASMSWGEGNLPRWDPTRFGVLTLIDSQ